jgi:mannose-6-phosphate isomerase
VTAPSPTPQRLRPDNFTPPSRTPWGGRQIVSRFKRGLELGVDPEVPVGESWEISIEPSFPSVLESGTPLAEAIAADPQAWLGGSVAAEYGGCPLLVKIVDAADDLSVQVHPPEHHALLAAGESGKTEAWVVLAAEPDARIYLGFRDGVDRDRVDACLRDGGRLSDLMNGVRVGPGQVFVIRPGLAHALGAGTTVLEPQRVWPGRRSVTYRYWDWNRRYDERGRVAESGAPRPLHITEAMAVTDWDGPRGAALVDACRRTPAGVGADGGPARRRLLDEPELWAERWTGTGTATLPSVGTLLALLCLEGEVELTCGDQVVGLVQGQSAVVPAAAGEAAARLAAAHLELCCVPGPS